MSSFKEISPYELENALKLIGKDWMLITARDKNGVNAMTASWGCLGVLWNKPVAVCFIRPQRHTFGLVRNEDKISLAFLSDEYRGALNICGTKSGKDCNKLELAGLSTLEHEGVPIINEASVALVCRKLYEGSLNESEFLDQSLKAFYNNGDFHGVFILEIEKALAKI
ncbi:MAG: flavin reductase family protein [Clostridia bacterium]|nr:flavin reductase family protein [Clostridia bacterium]